MPFDAVPSTTDLVSHPPSPASGPWRDPLALLLASTGEGVFGVDLDVPTGPGLGIKVDRSMLGKPLATFG